MKINLQGKTAFVSGSTSGMGKAIAYKLAENGCDLVLTARTKKDLEKVSKDIEVTYHTKVSVLTTDFNKPFNLEKKINTFLEKYPTSIDILINCVRGPVAEPISTMSAPQMIDTFNRHVVSSKILTDLFVPEMQQKRWGRIINIVDTIFKTPYPGLGLSTVRGAEASWLKALALELAEHQITVNAILPGPVDTPGLKEIIKTLAKSKAVSYEKFRADAIASIPIKRLCSPEEIANVALFLSAPEASYITGAFLNVDGGFSPSM